MKCSNDLPPSLDSGCKFEFGVHPEMIERVETSIKDLKNSIKRHERGLNNKFDYRVKPRYKKATTSKKRRK